MTPVGQQVVCVARTWIGTPYVHQASVRGSGADCLGLIRGVWREIMGAEPEEVPAYTQDWAETGGSDRLRAAMRRHFIPVSGPTKPGDVLLFRMRQASAAKHLGIAAKTGPQPTFIHAYSRHAVLESPLTAPWRARIAGRFRFSQEV